MPPRLALLLLTGLLAQAAYGAAAETTPSLLEASLRPGIAMADALAAARARGLELSPPEALPPAGRMRVVVAVPPGDDCSPRGAFLHCDGLRLYAEGDRLAMVESYGNLAAPRPAAELLREASARFGRPAAVDQMTERQRGRELRLLRYRWQLRQGGQVQRVTLTLVLAEEAAEALTPARATGVEARAAGIGLTIQRSR